MITALRTFYSLMFTQHHHRKQFTFYTLEPSVLKVYLMPHLIQTICAIIMMLSLKSATDDDEDDNGLFPSDEEYMGNLLTQETLVTTTTTTSITSSDILMYSNDIEYQVEDVPYHYIMYNAKKSNWYNPFKLDMLLFMNIVTKVVGTCPFNIDGNKIYQVKCDKSTWKEN